LALAALEEMDRLMRQRGLLDLQLVPLISQVEEAEMAHSTLDLHQPLVVQVAQDPPLDKRQVLLVAARLFSPDITLGQLVVVAELQKDQTTEEAVLAAAVVAVPVSKAVLVGQAMLVVMVIQVLVVMQVLVQVAAVLATQVTVVAMVILATQAVMETALQVEILAVLATQVTAVPQDHRVIQVVQAAQLLTV
jgi:hypothetical protein